MFFIKSDPGPADPEFMPDATERRRDDRFQCRYRCELRGGRKPVQGLVRDVSRGGVSVQLENAVDQGETLSLALFPKDSGPAIEIEAIVWHARIAHGKRSGRAFHLLGLVLSEASDDYLEMVETLRSSRSAPRPARNQSPASNGANVRRAPSSGDRRYRVRVQQQSSPRTRSIVVFAESTADARADALAEIGEGWNVLAVLPC